MVSEIEPFVCTECTSLSAESDPRIFAAIKQRTNDLDQCFKFISKSVLAFMKLKFRYFHKISPKKTSRDSHLSRTKPQRGRVTSSRARTPIPPVRNYYDRAVAKETEIFCCRGEPIPHRGNSCTAGTCSCESRVLCDRDYSHGTKKVD